MSVEISEGVKGVVPEFDEFELRTRLYLGDTLNDFGYSELSRQADVLEDSLENADVESEFDELVLRDMEHNLEATIEYADFLRGDSDLGTEEMFDLLYGEGAFDYLRQEAISFDDKAHYRAREIADELVFENPWKYELDIKQMAHDISDKIEMWSKEEGLMPEDFEFETHMIPQGSNQRANWRGEINQMNVPVGRGFYVIRDGDDRVYDATNAIFTQFHELVGHGVHQQNSAHLNYPQFAENPRNRPSSTAHCEGVSQHREQIAEEFIRSEAEDLPVLDVGMRLRKKSEDNRDTRKLYTRFISEMYRRDEIDEEEAIDLAGEVYKPEVAEMKLKNSSEYSLKDAFKEGCYSAGLMMMEDVGAENRSPGAVTTGQWSPKVFPDVVNYLESSL